METGEISTETVSSMITDSTTILTPPPRSGSYVPRQHDDRRPHSGGRRIPVDPREPGFDARSILVQGLVDRNRAHRVAAECMFQAPNVSAEPSEQQ